jgi:hypothetical protein
MEERLMAGTPRKRDMIAKLDGEGIEYVLSRITEGAGTRLIAKELGISRSLLYKALNSPEYIDRYRASMELRADMMAEDMLEIADTAPALTDKGNIDTGSVSDKSLRIETRKWLAAKMRPKFYDKPDVPPVTINLGDELATFLQGRSQRLIDG